MSLFAVTSKLFRNRRTRRRRQALGRAIRKLTQVETLEERRLLATMTFGNESFNISGAYSESGLNVSSATHVLGIPANGDIALRVSIGTSGTPPWTFDAGGAAFTLNRLNVESLSGGAGSIDITAIPSGSSVAVASAGIVQFPAGFSNITSVQIMVAHPSPTMLIDDVDFSLAPTADAGGPYAVQEGGSVLVSGSLSSDPDQSGSSLAYAWDFDSDGLYDDATGMSPTFSAIGLDGPTSRTIGLRVTDSSGLSSSDIAVVSIGNAIPMIHRLSGPSEIEEGSVANLSAIVSDPGPDGLQYTWDFGDGNTLGGTLSPSHVYADNGTYVVTLVVADDDGGIAVDTRQVTVHNVAPVLSAVTITPAIDENGTVNLGFSGGDVGTLDTHSIHVDWGDGSSNTFPVNTPGGFSFGTAHAYLDDNATDSFDVTLALTDDDGGVAVETRQVTVRNVAPVLSADLTSEVDEGGAATISGTFSDPGTLDSHTVVVDWGDGNTDTVPFQNATTVLLPVSDTVGRDDNLDGEYELLEADHFEAHKFELMPDRERRFAMEFDLSAFSATDTLQSSILSLYRVGGTPPGLATIEVFGYSGDGTVSADDMNAAYKIAGPFTDSAEDLASIDLTSFLQSRLDAGASHAGIVLRSIVVERQTQLASANNSDPAFRPKLQVQFANRHTFSATHPFLDDNAADSYPVTITLTDDDSGVAVETRQVTVHNVAPVLSALSITPAIDENGTVNLSFNGGDVGTLDTHTIHVNWGDGATNTFPINTPGGFSFGTIHTYLDDNAADSYTVTLTLTDDDGGVTVETRQVTVNNVAPALDSLNITSEVDENGIVAISGTFSDPGTLDTHEIVVNWGDGGTESVAFTNATTVLTPVSDTVGRDDNLDGEFEFLEADYFEAHKFELMPDRERRFAMEFDLSGFSTTDTLESSILSLYRVGGTPAGLATIEVYGYSGDGTVSADDMNAAYKIAGPFTDSAEDLASIDLTSFLQSRLDAGASHAGIVLRSIVVERQTQLASANNSDPAFRPKLQVQFANRHTFSATHPFLDDNAADSYPVTITLTDDDSGVAVETRQVTVHNVAPVLSALSITPAIDENGTVNLSFNGGDVGTLDTHTIHVNWGDGATNTFPFNTPGGFSFGTIHTYLDDNATDSYDVILALTDDDGGVAVEMRQVTVKNVAPVLSNFTFDASIDTSGVATISGTINGAILDPGTLDTHSLSFDFGDGTSAQQISLVQGQDSFSVTHTFSLAGTYNVQATLVDDDGGQAMVSLGQLTAIGSVSVNSLASATETASNPGRFLVSQSLAAATDTVVSYAVSGTAESSLDFTQLSGSVTIAAGTRSAEILVPVIDDSIDEGFVNETVVVTLATITHGDPAMGISDAYRQATIGIIDNDPDDDADGVGSNIEDPGGQGFDGNRDGISDALQSNVASLPNATNGTYVTIVSAYGGSLAGVVATTNPSPVDVPAGLDFASGFLEYEIQNIAPGGDATVYIFTAPGSSFTEYYKYGPTPDNHAPHWYDFRFDGTTGAKFARDRITLILVDGMRGDDDLIANGVIVDPGGPAGVAPSADLPLAHAGGPYVTSEGSSITLDASQSTVGGSNGSLTYEWDLDYDSLTFDVDTTGAQPTVSFPDNLPAHTIAVRVSDSTEPSKFSIATAAVHVFNVAPQNVGIASSVGEQVFAVGSTGLFSGSFDDVGTVDTHSVVWTFTHLDADGEIITETKDGTTIHEAGNGTVSDSFSFAEAGVYQVMLTVTDDDSGAASSAATIFVVYDPTAGFVTGGGWIQSPAGAFAADPTLMGKARFGFNSKYKKGVSVPIGNTEFQFKMADFKFKSTSYEWLVVSGAKARFRGVGSVNGVGDYGFELTAWDGQANGGDGTDRFRIKIWNNNQGNGAVYDNLMGTSDDDDPTALGGGSIVIHKESKALMAEAKAATKKPQSALTQAMLSQAVDQVSKAWLIAGVDAQAVGKLQRIHIEVADLLDGTLGISSDTDYVWIDRDAAGYNWRLETMGGWDSSVSDGMDLLSVVAHELGHKVGLDHSDDERDVMATTLAAGVRRLALPEENAAAFYLELASPPSLTASVSRSSLQHDVRLRQKESKEFQANDQY